MTHHEAEPNKKLPHKEDLSPPVTPSSTNKSPNSKNNSQNKLPDDPAFANTGAREEPVQTSSPIASVPSKAEKKKDSNFIRYVKKIAFSIWAVVMTIGMVLAFLISLFLV